MVRKIKLGWGQIMNMITVPEPPPAPENLIDGIPVSEYLKKVKCSTIEEAMAKDERKIVAFVVSIVGLWVAVFIMGIIVSIYKGGWLQSL
jgi:hypothetical protein